MRHIADRRCDLIILLADNMDALRNWAKYYDDNPKSTLDRFMGEPGWRDVLRSAPADRRAEKLRGRYCQRLQELGYEHFGSLRVCYDTGNDIYTLVYASRSEVGLDFWYKAKSKSLDGQMGLGF